MYFSSSFSEVIFFFGGCPTSGSLSLSSELSPGFPAAAVFLGGGLPLPPPLPLAPVPSIPGIAYPPPVPLRVELRLRLALSPVPSDAPGVGGGMVPSRWDLASQSICSV